MTDTEDNSKDDIEKPEQETLAESEGNNREETDLSPADSTIDARPEDPGADPAAHDDINLELTEVIDTATESDDDEAGDPYGGHAPESIRRILEAALFAAGTALSVAQLRALFESHERPHRKVVRELILELMAHYQNSGIVLIEVASGYRFQTRTDLGPWVSRLWEERPQKYSRALLETLALIAYRQPITRSEIEEVRGVSVSSSIVKTLQEREWVRIVGHRDVPGRPAMYATTRQFLDYFGLSSLDQLPGLTEIRDLDDINPELGLESPDERDNAGGVDLQAEISFSAMVDKLREGERSGKTGNEFIDEQLDSQLHEMDAVNDAIEQAFEAQRAGHNQPGLELTDEDTQDKPETTASQADHLAVNENNSQGEEDPKSDPQADVEEDSETNTETTAIAAADLSEEAQWQIIQQKLAQQQALLDTRESDPPGGDEHKDD